jgi:hypothetical protein
MNEISLEIPEHLKLHLELIEYINKCWEYDLLNVFAVPKERFGI